MKNNKVLSNTIMLYIMSIAKLIFPLLTLPYLTRVLSSDAYGFVSYVKSCMVYIQLLVDFGFILSSVKDIALAGGDKDKIGYIAGNTFFCKFILSLFAFVVLLIMCATIKILKLNVTYVILSFLAVATTAILADFLYRGIEKMHYITNIFLITKGISVALTFVFVKGDSSVMWIPVLDILAHLLSALISLYIVVKKMNIRIRISGIKDCFSMMKNSFVYFLSGIATTAFSALNTVFVGIYITDLTQVAQWSLCLNIIGSIQNLYAPICNSVYPHMIKEKSLSFIHKILSICMPVVAAGCIFSYFFAETALLIIGGEKYVSAYYLFRCLIPILFFSFPAQVYGWPSLGAIGKEKETTASTIIASVVQILGLILLVMFKNLTLIMMAFLRGFTEIVLMAVRMFFVYKNKKSFCGKNLSV